jgi:hypothetical protein
VSEVHSLEDLQRYRAVDADLRRAGSNNLELQKWGRTFMVAAVNAHLRQVPLFGMDRGPLKEEDVVVQTDLNQTGVHFALSTKDGKFTFDYEHGVLNLARAVDADMTGMFRDPSKIQHFADNSGKWTTDEAKRAADALVRAKGIDLKAEGAARGPIVKPESFNLQMPDGTKSNVIAFYSVGWVTSEDISVVDVRFRRSASGNWEPTEWFDNTTKTSDTESTAFKALYERFFLTPSSK